MKKTSAKLKKKRILKKEPFLELVPILEPISQIDHVCSRVKAREFLNSIATTQEWAYALAVSDRMIRMWATGEKKLPEDFFKTI